MQALSATFHGFVCLMLVTLFAVIPGSILISVFIVWTLGAAAFGARAAGGDPESPLKFIGLMYGFSAVLGGVLNLFLLLSVR